jgi:glycine C-acetyltransferase
MNVRYIEHHRSTSNKIVPEDEFMSINAFNATLPAELDGIRAAGLFKGERIIATPQGAVVRTRRRPRADQPLRQQLPRPVVPSRSDRGRARGAAHARLRPQLGALHLRHAGHHKQLESRLASFLGTEDTILYAAAFDANGGLFEPLLGEEDAIISDTLNHASIIDGIRLCKASAALQHNDMADLEALPGESRGRARFKLVFTDGVFSMDGTIARLDEMRALCDRYGALLGIDDAMPPASSARPAAARTNTWRVRQGRHHHRHARQGAGRAPRAASPPRARRWWTCCASARGRTCSPTPWRRASGGVDRGAGPARKAAPRLRDKLEDNTRWFRQAIVDGGLRDQAGEHPIIPIMVYDAVKAQALARACLELGVYAVGFFFPVVPKGQARIRVQMSAVARSGTISRPGRGRSRGRGGNSGWLQ